MITKFIVDIPIESIDINKTDIPSNPKLGRACLLGRLWTVCKT